MIDVYSWPTPNGHKVHIMLEETGLPYRVYPINIREGDQFKPSFLAISPNNRIPAIVDSDGPGGKPYTVIESGAILIYLAEKTGRFLPKDPGKRFDTIQWLMVQMANLGPMCGQLVHFSKYAPAGQDYGNARYRSQVNTLFDVYEQRLAAQPYVAGDEYTIADIAAFPWLRNVGLLAIDLAKRPHVKRWIDRIEARDAVKRALATIGTIKSIRDSATDEQKDRFFARGKYARA